MLKLKIASYEALDSLTLISLQLLDCSITNLNIFCEINVYWMTENTLRTFVKIISWNWFNRKFVQPNAIFGRFLFLTMVSLLDYTKYLGYKVLNFMHFSWSPEKVKKHSLSSNCIIFVKSFYYTFWRNFPLFFQMLMNKARKLSRISSSNLTELSLLLTQDDANPRNSEVPEPGPDTKSLTVKIILVILWIPIMMWKQK